MEHREVWWASGNVGCSCGQVFSLKGIKIHIGMMNKRNRLAIERVVHDPWPPR